MVDIEKYELGKGLTDEQLSTLVSTLAAGWAIYLLASSPGRFQIRSIFYKIRLTLSVVSHIFLSRDRSWSAKKVIDSGVISGGPYTAVKTVFFIRHGESDWNDIFNRGFGPMFPVRLVMGMLRELMKLPGRDSLFVDSPLSSLGARQAQELCAFLRSPQKDPAIAEAVATLKGEGPPSLCLVSNLRRAISTAVVGLAPRFDKGTQKLHVISELQEISRNPDALSITGAKEIPNVDENPDADQFLDGSLNTGNKPLRGTGLQRIKAFAEWTFSRPEQTVIATGHSLWFKHFFNTYLPKNANHVARSKKLSNCGVVSFTLYKGMKDGQAVYRIEPDTIRVITGKFM
mmetsp:Transcript_14807/g.28504  ORF Transcript_14807/g.28504 Transcript_14807/m.28504 type:complete len:344 (-) Transcript_14807:270-1301(-)|eukprot:CAMPEP_0114248540 /NCGR_PEP_ID=MMETSP0058-20121206/13628_1 /TAXON_ID=36894 /ORGANISM="Pyramimonas parkeae, CCMP726" /LENGTH=343 /DNA_ID=CAMNT_0001361955 /DNA_START=95 /DNA_END=1126 /DNA_ORIENTATION=+